MFDFKKELAKFQPLPEMKDVEKIINDNNIEMITVNYSKSVNGSYDSFKTMYESAKKAGSYVMTKAMSAVQTSSVKDVGSGTHITTV